MHFSVLDGWWVEGYTPDAGWALPMEQVYEDNSYQNELDSSTIYSIIEKEIAPVYYDVDPATGLAPRWISYIKNTVAKVASNFTTNRMLTDYINQYYAPQAQRADILEADAYAKAREIAAWKRKVRIGWNSISVVSYTQPAASYTLSPENEFKAQVSLRVGELSPEDIGVEMLFTTSDRKRRLHIQEKSELKLISFEDGVATYEASILPERTGMYQVATRVYPKNDLLPHKQDFPLVKWL